jgi:hypothetical protein
VLCAILFLMQAFDKFQLAFNNHTNSVFLGL